MGTFALSLGVCKVQGPVSSGESGYVTKGIPGTTAALNVHLSYEQTVCLVPTVSKFQLWY